MTDDEFEKEFFKLMNNAVFGKTLQNPRKQRTIDFVSSSKKAKRLVSQPLYKTHKKISENLYAIERSPTSILFDKPIYVGFSVLELSKLWMYKFHYDHVKKIYPDDESKLCFTDTDSFLYRLKTQNVHKDMLHHHELFDFSNFNPSHQCFSQMNPEDIQHIMSKNKKVLGKFKDELGGKTLEEFID